MSLLNRVVYTDTDDLMFVTMILVLLNHADRSFRYLSAGHRSYLLHAEGHEVLSSTVATALMVVDCPDPRSVWIRATHS